MAKKQPVSHDPRTEKGAKALRKLAQKIKDKQAAGKKRVYGKVQSVHGKAAQRAATKSHKDATRRRNRG